MEDPEYLLETERLRLRPFAATDADAERLYELDNDPGVMRYINGGKPIPRSAVEEYLLPRALRDAEFPELTTRGLWAAEERDGGAFVGWFELLPVGRAGEPGTAELGYRLRRAAWGKGYATEGSRALVAKGFEEFGVALVTANAMAVNTGSRRVMEKCGLTFLRAYTEEWPETIEGSEHGDVEYTLSRAAWAAAGQGAR